MPAIRRMTPIKVIALMAPFLFSEVFESDICGTVWFCCVFIYWAYNVYGTYFSSGIFGVLDCFVGF
jgi:hypothetical protein